MSDSSSSKSKTSASDEEVKTATKADLGQPGLEYPENPEPGPAGVIDSDESDTHPWSDGLSWQARSKSK